MKSLVKKVTFHNSWLSDQSTLVMHLPRQIIPMGTPWAWAPAVVLWDMSKEEDNHFITHAFAHQLKCAAVPTIAFYHIEKDIGYYSTCRYMTYVVMEDGSRIGIEAAGVDQISTFHEARAPILLNKRFPNHKLKGWMVNQPRAKIDVILSSNLLGKDLASAVPILLGGSRHGGERLDLYRSPYGSGYLLDGWSRTDLVPHENFQFKITQPPLVMSSYQEVMTCSREADLEDEVSKDQQCKMSSFGSEPDVEESDPEQDEWDLPIDESPVSETSPSDQWRRECLHVDCKHPACPKIIVNLTNDAVKSAECNQLEILHPSCDCRCAETSQMMRDIERMLGYKLKEDEKEDFMYRIQDEYFNLPNQSVDGLVSGRLYRRDPMIIERPTRVARLQRLWLAALIFTHGLRAVDNF